MLGISNNSMGEDKEEKQGIKIESKSPGGGSSKPVGLRIVIQRNKRELNIVNKFMRMQINSMPVNVQTQQPSWNSNSPIVLLDFLKACFLCKKPLSPNKDVYMYRGDQGFCSVECRCRQMVMDEIAERESIVRVQYSPPLCRTSNRPPAASNRHRVHHKGISAMA